MRLSLIGSLLLWLVALVMTPVVGNTADDPTSKIVQTDHLGVYSQPIADVVSFDSNTVAINQDQDVGWDYQAILTTPLKLNKLTGKQIKADRVDRHEYRKLGWKEPLNPPNCKARNC